jgi:predicted ATPase with chaperone activity
MLAFKVRSSINQSWLNYGVWFQMRKHRARHGYKQREISLAHRNLLFLDELPEFGNRMLEMLRQPLEDKIVAISRSASSLTYPANLP